MLAFAMHPGKCAQGITRCSCKLLFARFAVMFWYSTLRLTDCEATAGTMLGTGESSLCLAFNLATNRIVLNSDKERAFRAILFVH